MQAYALFAPLAAVIAGAIGLILRNRELATIFDAGTGLAVRGEPVSIALIALSLVVAAACVIFAVLMMKNRTAESSSRALAPPSGALLGVNVVTGVVMLAGAAYYAYAGECSLGKTVALLFVILAVLAAAAFAIVPFWARRNKNDGWMCFFSVMPAVFYSLWLVGTYRNNAAEPVLLDYCYECLAIGALALASYFEAGFVFAKIKPGAAIATGLIAVYLCLTTFADERALSLQLMLLAAACSQIAVTSTMLFRLKAKQKQGAAD